MVDLSEVSVDASGRLVAKPSKKSLSFLEKRDKLRSFLTTNYKGLLEHELHLGPESEVSFLSRFIIATNGRVKDAASQIAEYHGWMQENNMSNVYRWPGRRVLQNLCDPLELDNYYPLYVRGRDRFGHPVLYAAAGR